MEVRKLGLALMLSGLLSGCFGPTSVPVSDRTASVQKSTVPVRVVRNGETLYSIAWDSGSDPDELARINKINTPYRVRPGQKLVLSKTKKKTGAISNTTPLSRSNGSTTTTPKAVPKPKATLTAPSWRWPLSGEVVRSFAPGKGYKGIDISAPEGRTVRSAADGRVVYAGAGLRGYGRLVIVKHADQYLSAYAHNRRLNVAEGEFVKAGQKIAEVGRSSRNRPELHFEIRRNGKPLNPVRYLPAR